MSQSTLLLKGGTVITHGSGDHIKAIKADLLIEGNKIAKIAQDISAPSDSQTIDCEDKIVAPGFIDTHRHMWNTALRGRHADELVMDYATHGKPSIYLQTVGTIEYRGRRRREADSLTRIGILQSSNYTPDDVFWGVLGGYLEAIDSGTTTVVDHAHLNYSPDHCMCYSFSSP